MKIKAAKRATQLILLNFSIKSQMFSTITAAAKLHCLIQVKKCEFTELLPLGLSSSAWNMTDCLIHINY